MIKYEQKQDFLCFNDIIFFIIKKGELGNKRVLNIEKLFKPPNTPKRARLTCGKENRAFFICLNLQFRHSSSKQSIRTHLLHSHQYVRYTGKLRVVGKHLLYALALLA